MGLGLYDPRFMASPSRSVGSMSVGSSRFLNTAFLRGEVSQSPVRVVAAPWLSLRWDHAGLASVLWEVILVSGVDLGRLVRMTALTMGSVCVA